MDLTPERKSKSKILEGRFNFSGLPMTVYELLATQAASRPEAVALLAPHRPPMSYQVLLEQIERVRTQLNRMGIGRGDRIATVLPNGPEMAATFLSISSFAVCAPLNPDFRALEYDFYLGELKPRVLIVPAGTMSAAVPVAESQQITILELTFNPEVEAGLFELRARSKCNRRGASAQEGIASQDDVALLLPTSGTTSRQKIVPLKHRNICSSAHGYRLGMGLRPDDRCLCMMPLFHTHGLVAATLSTLAAGGSVVCTPGFVASHFFNWLADYQPTWYPAVSTVHQMVLALAQEDPSRVENSCLRMLFSGSAPLPPQVAEGLEQLLGIPILEGYGMTEVTNLICLNPHPPQKSKLGSVGLPAVPSQVAIMDTNGNVLPQGQEGEIILGGDLVDASFDDETKGNPDIFVGGWFRTGDLGYFDVEGYLFLTGRLKELINRGGEKVSPREVDEVLLDHPAVAQAVTFAIPDNQLGEEVAAAVVLKPQMSATALEVQEFASRRLADFKIPRRIVLLKEIPKGPTGKLKRIGLAQKLGLSESGLAPHRKTEYVAPRNNLERELTRIWEEVLQVHKIGVHDNFLALGGDSVMAARVIARLNALRNLELSIVAFFESLTVEGVAKHIAQLEEGMRSAGNAGQGTIVRVSPPPPPPAPPVAPPRPAAACESGPQQGVARQGAVWTGGSRVSLDEGLGTQAGGGR